MNITTKFQPGDKAVRLSQNRVQAVTVEHVEIHIRRGGGVQHQQEICYHLSDGNREAISGHDNYEYEKTLFATKEELLASL